MVLRMAVIVSTRITVEFTMVKHSGDSAACDEAPGDRTSGSLRQRSGSVPVTGTSPDVHLPPFVHLGGRSAGKVPVWVAQTGTPSD